jgi:hypothetical protein
MHYLFRLFGDRLLPDVPVSFFDRLAVCRRHLRRRGFLHAVCHYPAFLGLAIPALRPSVGLFGARPVVLGQAAGS